MSTEGALTGVRVGQARPDVHHNCGGQKGDALEQFHKRGRILDACKWSDVTALRSLANSRYGLVDDELRRAAWPILLGLSFCDAPLNGCVADSADPRLSTDHWESLPCHGDEDQVKLDVNRSFIFYPDGQSEAQLVQRKAELRALIIEVLRRYPYLCYFQGFHDICQVILLVMDPAQRAGFVARLCVLRIRDFMLPSLKPTTIQLRLLPDILARADPELRSHLAPIEPFYALAVTLTMYAHSIKSYHDIARLFDVFLAREPVFSIYVFAQMIMDRRDEILDIDETDMLQVILAKVPDGLNIDNLIAKSTCLFDRHPPDSLYSWRSISNASVLKTSRDMDSFASQTLAQGQGYFQQQAKEIWWSKVRHDVAAYARKVRRSLGAVGLAVVVAAAAFYLRSNPNVERDI